MVLTVAVTVPLSPSSHRLGVPSAALFAALIVGIVLALLSLAPRRVPRKAGIAAQGVLGVYIGTMVHRDALGASAPTGRSCSASPSPRWCSASSPGALLGLHRDVSPLTGALALVAGGASGLVAIARELGGDDRVVAVVQYLRVALITASMPVVVTLVYHAEKTRARRAPSPKPIPPPWYLSIAHARRHRARRAPRPAGWSDCPAPGLLGPMAVTIALELTGTVVRPVGADGAGAGRLRRDRLAGRASRSPANRCGRSVARCPPRSG